MLVPPESSVGTPLLFYITYGGPIANLVFDLIFFVSFFLEKKGYLLLSLLALSFFGVLIALENAIPTKHSLMNNDGYNTLLIA